MADEIPLPGDMWGEPGTIDVMFIARTVGSLDTLDCIEANGMRALISDEGKFAAAYSLLFRPGNPYQSPTPSQAGDVITVPCAVLLRPDGTVMVDGSDDATGDETMDRNWRTDVYNHGERILTIEHASLSGKASFSDEESEVIRLAGENLLGFIGDDDQPLDEDFIFETLPEIVQHRPGVLCRFPLQFCRVSAGWDVRAGTLQMSYLLCTIKTRGDLRKVAKALHQDTRC